MESTPRSTATKARTIQVGDLTVNRMGYGAMRLCGAGAWGKPRDPGNARQVLARALALGVNFIDTADSYGPEVNETQIAEALYPYPKGVVIATKGGLVRPDRNSWAPSGRPEHLRRALEGSLTRLRLDRIDLYQLHAPDPKVPFLESVGTLVDLQGAGKIRHIGISNVSCAQIDEVRGIATIVSVQNQYNLSNRTHDDVIDHCERLGIAFLPWFPLGGQGRMLASKIKRVAERHGATTAQVALAWLHARSPLVLPIPGTGSIEHLEENIRAAELTLAPQDLAELE